MGERCVAGIEVSRGKPIAWVRPVSKREHEDLDARERRYRNGDEPKLLDLVEMLLLEPRPHGYQTENWLIDPKQRWKLVGSYSWDDLVKLVSYKRPLWIDGYNSQHGLNDHVPIPEALTLDHSLRIIHVPWLTIRVFKVMYRPAVQAEFTFAGSHYRLRVTDPAIEAAFLDTEGQFELGESCLTVSLGMLFNDSGYKLVAGVLPKP